MKSTEDEAWNEFWALDARRGTGSGCLPSGWQGIHKVQREVWRRFANRLQRGARVLDIGTGDGRVMGFLLEARRDLKAVGVDLAPHLPPPPRGAKIRGGIRMSELPFPAKSFAAVTSQFGFEYGDMPAAAAEAARVLRPGGFMAIMTHRADGPIVSHNRERRRQIEWAVDERDLPAIARRSLQMRQLGIALIPPHVSAAPAEGARLFGQQSAAWEIAEAIRQTLLCEQADNPARVSSLIDEIEAQARNELGRIASLEKAAAAASDPDRLSCVLNKAELEQVSLENLFDGRSEIPFAEFRLCRLGS